MRSATESIARVLSWTSSKSRPGSSLLPICSSVGRQATVISAASQRLPSRREEQRTRSATPRRKRCASQLLRPVAVSDRCPWHGSRVQVIRDLCDLAGSNQRAPVTRLRSGGARAVRSHKSRKSRSVVFWTRPGETCPKLLLTWVARCASASSFSGISLPFASGS